MTIAKVNMLLKKSNFYQFFIILILITASVLINSIIFFSDPTSYHDLVEGLKRSMHFFRLFEKFWMNWEINEKDELPIVSFITVAQKIVNWWGLRSYDDIHK